MLVGWSDSSLLRVLVAFEEKVLHELKRPLTIDNHLSFLIYFPCLISSATLSTFQFLLKLFHSSSRFFWAHKKRAKLLFRFAVSVRSKFMWFVIMVEFVRFVSFVKFVRLFNLYFMVKMVQGSKPFGLQEHIQYKVPHRSYKSEKQAAKRPRKFMRMLVSDWPKPTYMSPATITYDISRRRNRGLRTWYD